MMYFIPWVILIVAAIVAVPVAAKMSPGPRRAAGNGDQDEMDLSGEGAEDAAVLEDDFGDADAGFGEAEAIGDDAFGEFK